jgi:hypothetical protein
MGTCGHMARSALYLHPFVFVVCASVRKHVREEKWRKKRKRQVRRRQQTFFDGREHARQTRPPFSIFGRINDDNGHNNAKERPRNAKGKRAREKKN